MVFIDFRKAFDSIRCDKMMEIVYVYGIPQKIVAVVNLLRCKSDTKARVVTPDGKTEFFDILGYVLQGEKMTLFFFAKTLDIV